MTAVAVGMAAGAWLCVGINAIRKALRPMPAPKPAARHARLPLDFDERWAKDPGSIRWMRFEGVWVIPADDLVDLLNESAKDAEAAGRTEGAGYLRGAALAIGRQAIEYDAQRA